MEYWKTIWRGEKDLKYTFWRIGVALNFVIYILASKFYQTTYTLLSNNYNCTDVSDCIGFIAWIANNVSYTTFFYSWLALKFVYIIFASVSVWRSAMKYISYAKTDADKNKTWGYLAIVSIVVFILVELASAHFVHGFTAFYFPNYGN
ncbi:MAG: hypothetical protein P8J14_10710 [Emcibacteraceae bacterium]|nr:hypothetical protein [Emcibacteraceae bacterium]